MKLLLIPLCIVTAIAQNTNMAVFPSAVATDSDLLVANDNAQTTLSVAITSAVTSIAVTDASRFVPPVAITVDLERMKCTSRSGNTLTCVRGQYGSTAVSHGSKAKVYGYIIAWHHNQAAAEIKAIESYLFGTPSVASANTGLSNLIPTSINQSLIPDSPGSRDLGSTPKSWRNIFFSGSSGNPGVNYFELTGTSSSGLRTITVPDANSNTVQGIGNPSDTQVVNYIDANGVQHRIAQSGGNNLSNLSQDTDGTIKVAKGFSLPTPVAATYNVNGTTIVDFSQGPISLVITGNTTLAFQNMHGFGPLYILAKQDGTGHANPFTYPVTVLGAPQPVATANKTTLIACIYDASTNFFCSALATDDTNSYFPDTVIYAPGHVTDLPACTTALKGGKRVVDDATAPTFLGTVSGSGSVVVPVLCNGTDWVAY